MDIAILHSIDFLKINLSPFQVTVWEEETQPCLGCAQLSLAEFDPSSTSVKWYNVLSFHFMENNTGRNTVAGASSSSANAHAQLQEESKSQGGTLKEESSDDSTVISSQTSTLTRNVGPEAMMAHAASTDGGKQVG